MMNNRIIELMKEAGKTIPGDKHIDADFCEKFVELIVRDCAELCTNVVDYHAILNNFGFEHIPDFEDFGDGE